MNEELTSYISLCSFKILIRELWASTHELLQEVTSSKGRKGIFNDDSTINNMRYPTRPTPPQAYYVKRLHTWRNFCERLFARNFAIRRFREKDVLREILREESDSSISYVSGNWFKSPKCQSAFNHHQSIDLSHLILSIFLNLLIRLSKSIRVDTLLKEIFFKILFSCVHAWVRAHNSLTP